MDKIQHYNTVLQPIYSHFHNPSKKKLFLNAYQICIHLKNKTFHERILWDTGLLYTENIKDFDNIRNCVLYSTYSKSCIISNISSEYTKFFTFWTIEIYIYSSFLWVLIFYDSAGCLFQYICSRRVESTFLFSQPRSPAPSQANPNPSTKDRICTLCCSIIIILVPQENKRA